MAPEYRENMRLKLAGKRGSEPRDQPFAAPAPTWAPGCTPNCDESTDERHAFIPVADGNGRGELSESAAVPHSHDSSSAVRHTATASEAIALFGK